MKYFIFIIIFIMSVLLVDNNYSMNVREDLDADLTSVPYSLTDTNTGEVFVRYMSKAGVGVTDHRLLSQGELLEDHVIGGGNVELFFVKKVEQPKKRCSLSNRMCNLLAGAAMLTSLYLWYIDETV